MSAAERAWDEYLAWTRNASPGQYVETEEAAWRRLRVALGLDLPTLESFGVRFTPEESFPGTFTPEGE